jgi:hypothetical protein
MGRRRRKYSLEIPFSNRLKIYKDRLQLSHKELRTILEVSHDTLEGWIYGTVTPHILTQEGAYARLDKVVKMKV